LGIRALAKNQAPTGIMCTRALQIAIATVLLSAVFALLVAFPASPVSRAKHEKDVDCRKAVGATCETFGGCHYYCDSHDFPGVECQCTSQCVNFGNCCDDYADYCMLENDTHINIVKKEMERAKEMKKAEGDGLVWRPGTLMVLFLLTMMLLVYLVSDDRSFISSAGYQVISTTVSVFAASHVCVLFHGFVVMQLLEGSHPGLDMPGGPLPQFFIFSVAALLWCVLSNAFLYNRRKQDMHMYSFGTLSNHFMAFLFVRAFGSLQLLNRFEPRKAIFLVLPLSVIFLWGLVFLVRAVRKKINSDQHIEELGAKWQFAAEGSDTWKNFDDGHSQEIEKEFQQALEDGRQENSSDVEGSTPVACMQCGEDNASFDIKSWRPEALDQQRDMHITLNKESCTGTMEPFTEDGDSFEVRLFCGWDHFSHEAMIEVAAMTSGFLLLQVVLYWLTGYFHSIEGLLLRQQEPDFALGFFAFSFLVVFSLLCCFEHHICGHEDLKEFLRASLAAAFAWFAVRAVGMAARSHCKGCTEVDATIVAAIILTWFGLLATVGVFYNTHRFYPHEEFSDHYTSSHHVAAKVHKLAEAFGLAIGLAWDKAFEANANDITSGGHYVIKKALLADLVIGFVLPGWYLYFVPRAHNMDPRHHHKAEEDGQKAPEVDERENTRTLKRVPAVM